MDHQQWSLRTGAAVILCALLIRLTGLGVFQPVASFLTSPDVSAFLWLLETGRNVRFPPSEPEEVFALESPPPQWEPPALPTLPEALPCFSAADAEGLEFYYSCALRPDLPALMEKSLRWDLTGDAPAVLIYHTHATESYTKAGEPYEESAAYRTLDTAYNVVSVGDRLTELLTEAGISVLHDRSLHDYPSYNGSYASSRASVRQALTDNPSLRLVLDLHRDAFGGVRQAQTHAIVDGQDASQLMLVVGSNHEYWEQNLSLAVKLYTQMERISPGICRPINLRGQRFNQDQSPGALLVEVGTAGDSHQDAMLAVEVLARGIIALSKGAVTESSAS